MSTTITGLPNASTPLSGAERVPMDQAGGTVDATTQDIANLAPGTNLTYSAATRTLSSSTGNNAVFPLATTTDPGLLSAADKAAIGTTAAALAAHVAAADPHPNYLTSAEGSAAYAPLASAHDSVTLAASVADVLGLTGQQLGGVNPGAGDDRILFWDHSAGRLRFLALGANLVITDTTLDGAGGGGGGGGYPLFTAPTGFNVTGSGTSSITLAFATGYALPTSASQANWDAAYSERLRWDGGATGLNASTARNSLQLGTAATAATTDFATAGQGALATTAIQPSDSRLTDAREWSAATVSQADAEAGIDTNRRAWTVQRVWQAIAAWWTASAAKAKLDGIAPLATANATDAQLRDRSTHTGTQPSTTITGLGTAATAATTDFATAAQGALASTSIQPGDSRLTDAREWLAPTVTQADAEAGIATDRRAWTVQRVWQAVAAWWAQSAAATKLATIANGATANATDAQLRDRSTHTGTQSISTITGLGGAASLSVGTTAGTVAAGDDSRITGALSAAAAATTYQPLDSDLTAIAALTTTVFGRSLLTTADASAARLAIGAGTVTSVGLSLPALFSVSNSPVTGSGTLTGALAAQPANRVLAGPTSGADAAPTMRALVTADLPTTGITPGSYTNVNCTVDATGRITAISNGTGGGGGSSTPNAYVVGNYICPYPGTIGTGAASVAGSATLVPFIPLVSCTVSDLFARVVGAVASSLIHLMIYESTGNSPWPTNCVGATAATLSGATSTAIEGSVTPFNLTANRVYWMVANANAAGITMISATVSSGYTMSIVGASTAATVFTSGTAANIGYSTTITFGTTPSLASASFALNTSARSTIVGFKVSAVL